MNGRHITLPAPELGRDQHVWCYGHFGPPVLVFPTAAGMAHEWQQQGMIEALAPLMAAGRMKLYCPESNVSQAWTKKEVHAAERIGQHLAYERWVMQTLVPFIRQDCHAPEIRIATVGASLGGMYAALFGLRHPETFWWSLCMSGRYKATVFTQGFTNYDVYLNDPLSFVPNLTGPELRRLERTHFTLVCGQGKFEEGCIEETIELAAIMRLKGIPHERDIWGRDVAHQWPWWKRQALYHFSRRL